MDRERIRAEIAEHKKAIIDLEAELGDDLGTASGVVWPPAGFYLTYHVVAGLVIGVLGSLTSFLFNIFGSLLVAQDPYRILRVYGTVFLGEQALTTNDLNFFMLVAIVHFSVGAMAGAVFQVFVNSYAPDRPGLQIALGAAYGLLMWIVNFYFVLSWLEPMLVGRAFVLQLMPFWVAALTHLVYGLTLGVLQPLGRFVPYEPVHVGT